MTPDGIWLKKRNLLTFPHSGLELDTRSSSPNSGIRINHFFLADIILYTCTENKIGFLCCMKTCLWLTHRKNKGSGQQKFNYVNVRDWEATSASFAWKYCSVFNLQLSLPQGAQIVISKCARLWGCWRECMSMEPSLMPKNVHLH